MNRIQVRRVDGSAVHAVIHTGSDVVLDDLEGSITAWARSADPA
jgi:predicted transglutaminase-like cysteine proteinase